MFEILKVDDQKKKNPTKKQGSLLKATWFLGLETVCMVKPTQPLICDKQSQMRSIVKGLQLTSPRNK